MIKISFEQLPLTHTVASEGVHVDTWVLEMYSHPGDWISVWWMQLKMDLHCSKRTLTYRLKISHASPNLQLKGIPS